MSVRLQVILRDPQMARLRQTAALEGVTVSEWVRRVLDEALDVAPESSVAAKIARIRAAAEHTFPTGDIDQMLAEIAAGRRRDASGP